MSNKQIVAYGFILASLSVSIFILLNMELIIPGGYELGVDGIVISRNLILIFVLYQIFKLGYHLSYEKDEEVDR